MCHGPVCYKFLPPWFPQMDCINDMAGSKGGVKDAVLHGLRHRNKCKQNYTSTRHEANSIQKPAHRASCSYISILPPPWLRVFWVQESQFLAVQLFQVIVEVESLSPIWPSFQFPFSICGVNGVETVVAEAYEAERRETGLDESFDFWMSKRQ